MTYWQNHGDRWANEPVSVLRGVQALADPVRLPLCPRRSQLLEQQFGADLAEVNIKSPMNTSYNLDLWTNAGRNRRDRLAQRYRRYLSAYHPFVLLPPRTN